VRECKKLIEKISVQGEEICKLHTGSEDEEASKELEEQRLLAQENEVTIRTQATQIEKLEGMNALQKTAISKLNSHMYVCMHALILFIYLKLDWLGSHIACGFHPYILPTEKYFISEEV
jgi:hypothetical protein